MLDEIGPDRTIDLAFLIGGLVAMAFGVIILVAEGEPVGLMVLLLGLWWLIQGATLVLVALIHRDDMSWKVGLGLIGASAGIVVLANPVEAGEFVGTGLAFTLGALGLLAGMAATVGGFRSGGFSAMLFGVISGALGLAVMVSPADSFAVLVTIVAVILVAQGLVALYLYFAAR